MSDQTTFLRSPQVLRRYKITKMTLWRWLRGEKFPKPTYIGGRRYWKAEALDAWDAAKAAETKELQKWRIHAAA